MTYGSRIGIALCRRTVPAPVGLLFRTYGWYQMHRYHNQKKGLHRFHPRKMMMDMTRT